VSNILKVFVGFDAVETGAFTALCQSIQETSKRPVSITPIRLNQLSHVYKRPRDPKQSNEFSFTRFLVPYLCNYQGYALFMDCDMFLRCDINDIMLEINTNNAVSVVKHNHKPVEKTKYLGAVQYTYPRKNWSSVMLFNCEKCTMLTPGYINEATPAELHQFAWAHGDMLGELRKEWNHLVGYDAPNSNAKIVHYTIGGPWFDEYRGLEFEDEWVKHMKGAFYVKQRSDIVEGAA